jgi:hypothetical protein
MYVYACICTYACTCLGFSGSNTYKTYIRRTKRSKYQGTRTRHGILSSINRLSQPGLWFYTSAGTMQTRKCVASCLYIYRDIEAMRTLRTYVTRIRMYVSPPYTQNTRQQNVLHIYVQTHELRYLHSRAEIYRAAQQHGQIRTCAPWCTCTYVAHTFMAYRN